MRPYNLSLLVSEEHFDWIDDIIYLQILPLLIQQTLTSNDNNCVEEIYKAPMDPLKYEYQDLNFECLNKMEFIMLANHPSIMHPDFQPRCSKEAHSYRNYYDLNTVDNNEKYLLCHNCFLELSSDALIIGLK